MAILAIFTGKGISKSMYDTLLKEARYANDQPPGAIFHPASFDDKGDIHVADVWASPEELDAYVRDRLMPAFQKHGIPAPEVGVFPVHNIDAFQAMNQYVRS
jgi:hypothetical protein